MYTWDWSDTTGTGRRIVWKPDYEVKQDRDEGSYAGYEQVGPLYTRDKHVFSIDFKHLYPRNLSYLLRFVHSVRGGAVFIFPYPYELAGIPDEAGGVPQVGFGPMDTDIAVGAGEGPKYYARLRTQVVKYERKAELVYQHYYTLEPIVVEQV